MKAPSNEQTRAATETLAAKSAARRAELAARLLEDAERLRARLWQPCVVSNFGKDNTLATATIPEPSPRDKLSLITAAAVCCDKSLLLEHRDAEGPDGAAVDLWLAYVTNRSTRGG